MGITVYLAEKKSAAEELAKAMDMDLSVCRNQNGFYERAIGRDVKVVAYSNGHCISLKEPKELSEKYEKWRLEDLPIIYDCGKEYLTVLPIKRGLYQKLLNLLKSANVIINAGDAGREGELIQRWMIKMAGVEDKPLYRLWAQSMTQKALKDALDALYSVRKPSNDSQENLMEQAEFLENLYASGEARAVMDAFLGFNYSRAITKACAEDITVVYGRCQSPMVNLIIKRDEEIENFVPRKFFYIEAHFGEEKYVGTMADDKGERICFDTQQEALDQLGKTYGDAKIVKVKRERKRELPPKPYDILQLQKEMAKRFDYDAEKTLQICQKLYEQRHILSYPRTDSRYFTTDLIEQAKATLRQLDFGKFADYAKEASDTIPERYFNDKKVGDHHALMLTGEERNLSEAYEELDEDEKRVFDVIAESFLALALPAYEYEEIIAEAVSGAHHFILKGKTVNQVGFKKLYGIPKDTQDLSGLMEGEVFFFTAGCKQEITKPKPHYTTASLLDVMKVYNIGTGATRDTILKELTLKRGKNKDSYIKRDGKYFVSTEFGRAVNNLIPERLKSIEFLAELDRKLNEIADGTLRKEDFLRQLRKDVTAQINEMRERKGEKLKAEAIRSGSGFSCPICGSPLADKGTFYSCSRYALTGEKCSFRIYKEIRGKKLSDKTITRILTKGESSKLKFKSQKGTEYEAKLKLVINDDGAKIEVEFVNDERRKSNGYQ